MRLYLLRHGEVASHRGDVAITTDAERHAFEVGRVLGHMERERMMVLSGDTRRAKETAQRVVRGVEDVGGEVEGPNVAFALRNPDLYLSGTRVNMVSSADAFASQVEGLSPESVASLDFFPRFIESKDRIGWWLTHPSPPGESAAIVAARCRAFARSLVDPVPGMAEVVVAVTHSPLLRSVGLDALGYDIGDPPWVSGLLMTVDPSGTIVVEVFLPETT